MSRRADSFGCSGGDQTGCGGAGGGAGGGVSQEASDVCSKEMDEMVKVASTGSANRAVHDFVSRGHSMCSRSALKKICRSV